MRLLLDANIAPVVAERLRAAGHDAVHLRELGLARLRDEDVMGLADREQRIVITQDLDFARLAAELDAVPVSVVILRLRTPTADQVFNRVTAALLRYGADLLTGAVLAIDDSRIRLKRLPIG